MKAVARIILFGLLACLLAVAGCESGGGSGSPATPTPTPTATPTPAQVVSLLGNWGGAYRLQNGSTGNITGTVTAQNGRSFSGTFTSSPVGTSSFTGSIAGDQPACGITFDSAFTYYMGGTLSDANTMGGTFVTSGGANGYWQMVRQ